MREAFRAHGHNAWSCDLEPAEDGSAFHYQTSVKQLFKWSTRGMPGGLWDMPARWDLFIAHPDCTFLSVSGLHWNKRRPDRAEKTAKALAFVQWIFDLAEKRDVPLCLENPISCISSRIRKPDQIIQPYQFGHDASKATCLWLRRLPPIVIDPRSFVEPRMICKCGARYDYKAVAECKSCGLSDKHFRPRWANQTDSGQNRLGPSETRAMDRARTYHGIANAFAEQWGKII